MGLVLALGSGACAAAPPSADVFGDECVEGCEGDAGESSAQEAESGGSDEPGEPGSDAPAEPDDRPSGDDGGGDDGGDGDPKPPGSDEPGTHGGDADCCEAEHEACVAGGDTSSTCAALDTICTTGACETLTTVCDPSVVPVSTACARAYYSCFNLRVNKCKRTDYNQCFAALGDAELCAAWDASCADREAYCEELLDLACSTEMGDDECPDYGHLDYQCTDWGHRFDPCWDAYVACQGEPATCLLDLTTCAGESEGGGIYDTCPTGDGDHSGGGDPSDDPDTRPEPGRPAG